MTRHLSRSALVGIALALAACGTSSGDGEDEGGESGTTGSGEHGTSGDGGSSGDSGVEDDGATDEGGTSSDPGESTDGAFLGVPDGGVVGGCDVWTQDCPEGAKCMPWGDEQTHPTWGPEPKCTPIAPDPKQPGDTCRVEGHVASGIDDCDLASACYFADRETLQGTCVPFCEGNPDNPTCADPTATCVIANDGAIIFCLPACDPLVQDCGDGQACYWVLDGFACAQDYSAPGMGAQGQPCEYLDACGPGLNCTMADMLPACEGAVGCCSPFCDTTAPNTCPGIADGEECVPIWVEGEGPPEFEHVGVCSLP